MNGIATQRGRRVSAAPRRSTYLQYISTEDEYAFERPAILRALVEFWT